MLYWRRFNLENPLNSQRPFHFHCYIGALSSCWDKHHISVAYSGAEQGCICSFSDVFVDFGREITEKGIKLKKRLKKMFMLTFGDVIGPKKSQKYHRYRSNNRLWPNRFIYVYRIGNRIDLYFNNRKIIGLNRMGRLKHWIKIFFGRSTKNFTEKKL